MYGVLLVLQNQRFGKLEATYCMSNSEQILVWIFGDDEQLNQLEKNIIK